jgi:nucleolar protein 14
MKHKSEGFEKKKKADVKKVENPFEIRVNRRKHEVLGQKTKGEKGKRGVARDRGNAIRRSTLLVEHKNKSKTNQFVDRRFGEYDKVLACFLSST